MNEKEYLGDGVYARYDQDRFGIWLTTEDGVSVHNRIFLEPEVYESLVSFVEKIRNG